MRRTIALLVFLLTGVVAWADIPAPPPQGQRVVMRISQDSVGAGGPVLEIPARLFRSHAAFFDIASPLPVPRSRSGLIVAGIFLSAAIFLAGRAVWKRRMRQSAAVGPAPKKIGRAANLMLAFAALLGAGSLMRTASADNYYLDAGNLGQAAASGPLQGQVAVRLTDGDAVILHLTPPRHRPGPPPQGSPHP